MWPARAGDHRGWASVRCVNALPRSCMVPASGSRVRSLLRRLHAVLLGDEALDDMAPVPCPRCGSSHTETRVTAPAKPERA
jgi:hypothetical protein